MTATLRADGTITVKGWAKTAQPVTVSATK